jgi:N-acetylneuraminic acid mutarotase
MKIKEFSLTIITFLVVLILSMNVYADYDDVYAQGGSTHSRISSPWTNGAPLPNPRSEIAGAALNGNIYIIGGFGRSGQSTTTVEVYDAAADKWTTASPLPQPLDHTAAASFNGKLYVVGGGI